MPRWTGLKKKFRLKKIKEDLLENKTWQHTSDMCRFTRQTIYSDFKEWILTEDFKLWIHEQYIRRLGQVNDDKALKSLTS